MAFAPATAKAARPPVFYLCAHPDDCLLFMGPNLYEDISLGSGKTVIIYLTSGDAGREFMEEGASYPYMREQASLEATDWIADIEKETPPSRRESEVLNLDGNIVERVRYARTVSYFLRLPDGGMEGAGFERYGFESMHKLQSGEIPMLRTVDGRPPYADWRRLTGVLAAILARESVNETQITVHVQDSDTVRNPGDHADHRAGAAAMEAVLAQRVATGRQNGTCDVLYRHVGYAIATKDRNITDLELQNKSAAFAVLSATERRYAGVHDWNRAHTVYLPRNYFTVETLPNGCGAGE